jgi:L-iditol 2-dehydrogenase
MKRVVQTGIGSLDLIDAPAPSVVKPTDVRFKIDAVGVCGSDIHYYRTGRIGNQIVDFPFPIGHECSGTVIEVGDQVTRVKPGDHIAIDPAISCFACEQCRKGNRHMCASLRFMGCPGQADGCLCEEAVMPEENCFAVPDSISAAVAALIEPLTIGCYAVSKTNASPGMHVGILGLGPIGLSVLIACRAAGIQYISGSDPLSYRRAIAQDQGVGICWDPSTGDIPAELDSRVDLVFDCCGFQNALNDAAHLAAPGGTIAIVGIPEQDEITFNPHVLRRKELTVTNIRRQNQATSDAIDLVAKHGIDISFMHTHTFSLSESRRAFDLVQGYEDGVIKAIITPRE